MGWLSGERQLRPRASDTRPAHDRRRRGRRRARRPTASGRVSTRVQIASHGLGQELDVRGLDVASPAAHHVDRRWSARRRSRRRGTSTSGPSRARATQPPTGTVNRCRRRRTCNGSVARTVCTISPLTRISSVSTGAIDVDVGLDAHARRRGRRRARFRRRARGRRPRSSSERAGREERAAALDRVDPVADASAARTDARTCDRIPAADRARRRRNCPCRPWPAMRKPAFSSR